VWNRNPACSWSPGRIAGLVTLCNNCFQIIGRRHFLKGRRAPLPDNAVVTATASINSEDRTIGKGAAATEATVASSSIKRRNTTERAKGPEGMRISTAALLNGATHDVTNVNVDHLFADFSDDEQNVHAPSGTCPHGRTCALLCPERNGAPEVRNANWSDRRFRPEFEDKGDLGQNGHPCPS